MSLVRQGSRYPSTSSLITHQRPPRKSARVTHTTTTKKIQNPCTFDELGTPGCILREHYSSQMIQLDPQRPERRIILPTLISLIVWMVPVVVMAFFVSYPVVVVIPAMFAYLAVYAVVVKPVTNRRTCSIRGCPRYTFVGWVFQSTCYDHVCVKRDCWNFVIQPSSMCLNHPCQRETCQMMVTTQGKDYCDRHACIRTSCKRRKMPGLQTCLEHKCQLCESPGLHLMDDVLLCNDHIPCSTDGCVNNRAPGLDVCQLCDDLEARAEPPPTYAKVT